MLTLFLYEFVTGGGLWRWSGQKPSGSLLAEGQAMILALAADFAALPDVKIGVLRDSRLPPLHPAACLVTVVNSAHAERAAILSLAAAADWTLLIAPETNGALLERAWLVERAGGRLISPPSDCIEIAANKQTTAEHLSRHGIKAPVGAIIDSPSRLPPFLRFPCILKPADGCGSQGIRLVREARELAELDWAVPRRIETFVRGLPASVAVICGPAGRHALPASEQRLAHDGSFAYLGGRLPLAPRLDSRARQLALAAVASLPNPLGYLGIDLVLGDATDGSGDCVIEINPRVTTSYVGLRSASQTNLAIAMLAAVHGDQPDLRFRDEALEFTADGSVGFFGQAEMPAPRVR